MIKAFRKIRRDLPSIPLNLAGLLKAWFALPANEKKAIKDGIRKKGDYVKMDTFVFSFGARVRLETNDGQNSRRELQSRHGVLLWLHNYKANPVSFLPGQDQIFLTG